MFADRVSTSDSEGPGRGSSSKPPRKRRAVAKPPTKSVAVFSEERLDTTDSEHGNEPTGAKAKPTGKTASKKPTEKKIKKQAKKPKAKTSRSPLAHRSSAAGELPANSGAFAYARWAYGKLTAEQLSNVSSRATHEPPLRVGSLCSGMCTESLAFKALEQCDPKNFSHVLAFVCENDKRKLEFLQQRYPDAVAFDDIALFAKPPVKDAHGKPHDPIPCDMLLGGFSCKCLSGLTTQPKSVKSAGPTGVTLRGTFDYLRSLSWEQRPRTCIFENACRSIASPSAGLSHACTCLCRCLLLVVWPQARAEEGCINEFGYELTRGLELFPFCLA